jgi:predicted Zn-ribbon and HTH transcriptional regulator
MSKSESKTDAVSVTCYNCGYAWEYCGKTQYAQCPQCQKSNNLKYTTAGME